MMIYLPSLSPLYIYEHTLSWMINQGDPPVLLHTLTLSLVIIYINHLMSCKYIYISYHPFTNNIFLVPYTSFLIHNHPSSQSSIANTHRSSSSFSTSVKRTAAVGKERSLGSSSSYKSSGVNAASGSSSSSMPMNVSR